jgi:hypothetical protein
MGGRTERSKHVAIGGARAQGSALARNRDSRRCWLESSTLISTPSRGSIRQGADMGGDPVRWGGVTWPDDGLRPPAGRPALAHQFHGGRVHSSIIRMTRTSAPSLQVPSTEAPIPLCGADCGAARVGSEPLRWGDRRRRGRRCQTPGVKAKRTWGETKSTPIQTYVDLHKTKASSGIKVSAVATLRLRSFWFVCKLFCFWILLVCLSVCFWVFSWKSIFSGF